VTPISQQNPPGPLKLLGLREKTGKNTDFLILLKKTDFLVAHFVTSCGTPPARLTSHPRGRPALLLLAAPVRTLGRCGGVDVLRCTLLQRPSCHAQLDARRRRPTGAGRPAAWLLDGRP
jgi:hypothetical protein